MHGLKPSSSFAQKVLNRSAGVKNLATGSTKFTNIAKQIKGASNKVQLTKSFKDFKSLVPDKTTFGSSAINIMAELNTIKKELINSDVDDNLKQEVAGHLGDCAEMAVADNGLSLLSEVGARVAGLPIDVGLEFLSLTANTIMPGVTDTVLGGDKGIDETFTGGKLSVDREDSQAQYNEFKSDLNYIGKNPLQQADQFFRDTLGL